METAIRLLMLVRLFATALAFTNICNVSNPCDPGGVCSANTSGYTCHCYAGFIQKTPQMCADRDECSMVNGLCHNGTCANTPGSFKCTCNDGFSGSRCLQKANPCDSSPCLKGAKCTPASSSSGYTCTCYAGYLPPNCVDRDECSIVRNLCHNGSCVNTPGSFKCSCKNGYSGSRCTKRDPCVPSPCVNGDCTPSTSGSGYTCSCYAGFVPPQCTDRDECAMAANLCHNGTCVNSPGSYKCNCNTGFSGIHCTSKVAPVNPCGPSPCLNGGTCVQSATGYSCSCLTGFAPPNCKDMNECALILDLCHNGTCVNSIGSFRCNCHKGYTGLHCTIPSITTSSAMSTSHMMSSSSTTQKPGAHTASIVSANANKSKKGWTGSHWWVFAIAGVVFCAAAATVVVIIFRKRRAKSVGVYNKFNNNPPSTPTSPTPIQAENPLYMAIQNNEIRNPDAPSGPNKEGNVLYMTVNGNGNDVSEI